MAKNVADTGNVVNISRGRGRPKGSTKAATEAARKAAEMVSATKKVGTLADPTITPIEENTGADVQRAPAFGANEPDQACFLKHVQILRKDAEDEGELKLKLKNRKKVTKDHRQAAKAEGIVLGELDRALADAETELVDLVARERRYSMYIGWLGKPLDFQADLPSILDNSPDVVAKGWFNRGDQAGRLGKDRKAPDGIPPENISDWLKGYDAGQDLLMRNSPLTRSAFTDAASAGNAAVEALTEKAKPGILVLREEDFIAGTDLEGANLKTLMEYRRADFDAAERVVALFGTQRRILREPLEDGVVYVDTGEDDVELTEPEDVAPTDAVSHAEAVQDEPQAAAFE